MSIVCIFFLSRKSHQTHLPTPVSDANGRGNIRSSFAVRQTLYYYEIYYRVYCTRARQIPNTISRLSDAFLTSFLSEDEISQDARVCCAYRNTLPRFSATHFGTFKIQNITIVVGEQSAQSRAIYYFIKTLNYHTKRNNNNNVSFVVRDVGYARRTRLVRFRFGNESEIILS